MSTPFRGRYLYRLFGAFLAAGLLPAAVVSLSLGIASSSVLERSLVERAGSSAAIAAGGLKTLLDGYAALAEELAGDPAVVEYLANPVSDRDAGRTADANRRLYAYAREGRVAVYLVPAAGPTLGTAQIPAEYSIPAYHSWGALGFYGRDVEARSAAGIKVVPTVFGRPHAAGPNPAVFAVGRAVPATPQPEGPAGYVVIDLHRLLVEEFLSGAQGAFTDLSLRDPSGCVLFDLNGSYREGGFAEDEEELWEAPEGAYLDPRARRVTALARADYGVELVAFQTLAPVMAQTSRMRDATLLAGLLSAVAAVILALLFSRSIFSPVRRLVSVMGQVEAGDLGARLELPRNDDIGYLILSFNRMVSRVQTLVAETVEQHQRLRVSEARSLQARIDPHFLYNTLNSIKSIARLRGVEEIAVIATRLGKLLRSGFAPEGELCTLEESLELVKSYLEIEAIRYPGRFEFSMDVEGGLLGVVLPRLLVQPLVENAVYHGLEHKVGPGHLSLSAHRAGADLLIVVEDDGVGIGADRLARIEESLRRAEDDRFSGPLTVGDGGEASAGIALANIHRRVRLSFGPAYGLSLRNRPGGGVRAELLLPTGNRDGTPGEEGA